MTTREASELVARVQCRFPLWAFWCDAEGLTAARGSAIVRGASLGEVEERLTTYQHPHSLPGAPGHEFPDWQIDVHPGRAGHLHGVLGAHRTGSELAV